MTTTEVAAWLQVHPSSIYRLLRKRAIPAFRVGSDWRFYRRDLIPWMEALQVISSARPRRRERRMGGADPK